MLFFFYCPTSVVSAQSTPLECSCLRNTSVCLTCCSWLCLCLSLYLPFQLSPIFPCPSQMPVFLSQALCPLRPLNLSSFAIYSLCVINMMAFVPSLGDTLCEGRGWIRVAIISLAHGRPTVNSSWIKRGQSCPRSFRTPPHPTWHC